MHRTPANHARRRTGLTLVELVVSMAVMTLVMAGVGSAILISRHALPDADRTTTKILDTSRALHQMMEEIRMAVYVSEHTANAITFSVADRDGNGYTERIRYAWSGTEGDPLTRAYNDGSAMTILDDVKSMILAYDTDSLTESYPGAPVWSSEQVLSAYIGAVDEREYNCDSTTWMGQHFYPAPSLFSPQSLHWRVTQARVVGRKDASTNGTMRAQITNVDSDHKPGNTAFAETTFYESSLTSSHAWTSILYPNCAKIPPGEHAALRMEYISGGGTVAFIRYDQGAGTGMLETSNAGSSWNYRVDQAMQYEIHGQVAEPGSDQTVTRQYLESVALQIETQGTASTLMSPATTTLNRPEILSAMWEADFVVDPTAADDNADGQPDWVTHDGTAFDPAALTDGTYSGTHNLLTSPDHDFNEVVTIEATLRSTAQASPVPGLLVYADWSGGEALFLNVFVAKQPDGTQNLIVGDTVASAFHPLITVQGLSADFFDVRLIIDPGVDTVALFTNGEHVGTEHYQRETPSSNEHRIRLQASNGAAEFRNVSIRAGGTGS